MDQTFGCLNGAVQDTNREAVVNTLKALLRWSLASVMYAFQDAGTRRVRNLVGEAADGGARLSFGRRPPRALRDRGQCAGAMAASSSDSGFLTGGIPCVLGVRKDRLPSPAPRCSALMLLVARSTPSAAPPPP